ncbi:type I DNA topoisomerase [Longimicrobium terrae]|uniref:DNA topoisomerase 1 n=1 Tax=Longimicrobium terrae TaxID=1639882 RepID=A0A841H5P8_9BACT|nr:type I DNA topoisomerase [Longimicrobium terrae]MBB4639206.1 DNA topoisomerase-1 [Longimicrobium terrae]MBB6073390.1 DNA topoisomerase-1 [Longimicrobium terrae]NNC32622.1 type I DNA topoisomerase [Longimicrobium terrae]
MAVKKDKRLVVVESPTKAKTIRGFLPAGYVVAASMGHVRDLPESATEIPPKYKGQEWARLGVNVDDSFEPLYVVPAGKRKIVAELKALLKDAGELIVATDEDREGESIGWHLVQVLEPKVPVTRIVFHEITPEAIRQALATPRQIDEDLVRAQETRRILDRLVGYTVSPLLWKKISTGLSAGRVQSVAVRLLVRRERERRAFRNATYWDLKATLLRGITPFGAVLTMVGGKRVATGRDFDENTGQLKSRDVVLLGEEDARSLQERLRASEWKVGETEEKPTVRRPYPPFTTSTLQQEANRKLRLSARDTMRVAQRLYEEGHITYMRTDSVHLSDQAIKASRSRIEGLYGKEFLSPSPRQFTTKSKGAQEAHEAIRPAGTEMRTVDELRLAGVERALYDLIWKRTVASQMAEARLTYLTATIEADGATFRASGKRIDFPGFFRAYVEGSDDPDAALEDREEPLPPLNRGDALGLRNLEAVSHTTQPPARYTEATLVKTLEAEGIGRPSTYASIIGTVIDRGYVERVSNQLVPTFTAFAVTGLLERNFPSLVDTHFTARMEEELDEIAEGDAQWLPYLKQFFLGPDGLDETVKRGQESIDPREASTVTLEGCPARVRIGRFGPFVEMESDGATVTASIPDGIAPADLSDEQVEQLVRQKAEGPDILGTDPATNEPIYLLQGRFGPYVQRGQAPEGSKEKPKRASLPKGMNPTNATLEVALRLLSLPRTLGVHPETGKEIQANAGRFGPYVVHDGDFRSLAKDDDLYTVELPRALELLKQPKGGRGQRAAIEPLRTLGAHPADGEPVLLFEGRYGPYVKHGAVNASLPKGVGPDEVTLEQAVPLLAERALAAPAPKRGAKRGAPAAKKPAPKTPVKKAADTADGAAKKPAARKPASKTASSARTAAAKTTARTAGSKAASARSGAKKK